MTIAAFTIAIISLILSIWSIINIIGICRNLDIILDILKLDQIKSSNKSPSEKIHELEAIVKNHPEVINKIKKDK